MALSYAADELMGSGLGIGQNVEVLCAAVSLLCGYDRYLR